jgi:hypothetical protein
MIGFSSADWCGGTEINDWDKLEMVCCLVGHMWTRFGLSAYYRRCEICESVEELSIADDWYYCYALTTMCRELVDKKTLPSSSDMQEVMVLLAK